jgi:hypothetical protein
MGLCKSRCRRGIWAVSFRRSSEQVIDRLAEAEQNHSDDQEYEGAEDLIPSRGPGPSGAR